jgi:ribonuclease-3
MERPLAILEHALGYSFRDPGVLSAALVHRSYHAEHPEVGHNERFEFLGDAVLGLAITASLFAEYPGMPEGQMAKVKAAAVSREELAAVARKVDLARYLLLGRGEESTGGRDKTSILADAMEAIIAAVFLDAGYEAANRFVLRHWEGIVRSRARLPGGADYKTRLQEVLAAAGLSPIYKVVGAGPDHRREFTASVLVDGAVRGEGTGASKREAEQEAARSALDASA